MYKKCYAEYKSYNKYLIHLWEDSGYSQHEFTAPAYEECSEGEAKYKGLNGEPLKKIYKWKRDNPRLHFHDMSPYQNFLIDKYGTNDEPSTTHKEIFFDIEIEMGDALTPEYIQSAPKKVTSIAWYYKQEDEWKIIILDPKQQIKPTTDKNKEIIPVYSEEVLLSKFLTYMRELDPDILIGYNSDYFDIPYLYYRIKNVMGEEMVEYLSPILKVKEKRSFKTGEIYDPKQPIEIAGVESLDYMRLHKKYSWEDEPSWKLDALGEKYAGLNKIEYEGSLDRLFEEDIEKFIEYNFRDVEILVELDKKLEYLALTKNLSHKGKHNYGEVYHNTVTQDGAISAYLLSQGIIPPPKEKYPEKKKGYAGGYLFCPKAGIYKYMFDEDLTSLYPCIIMSLNIGKETMVGRIVSNTLPENLRYKPYMSAETGLPIPSRNNYLGLNDLKKKDPQEELTIENAKGNRTKIKVENLINLIEDMEMAVSANGTFFRTDKKSVLSIILDKWFNERVKYKNQMKKAYKSGNSELGSSFHLKQYTMKILLNSLYGATALPTFRYAMNKAILSEAITLSGWRIIQESALAANRHINKLMKTEV
jgi:DNA polymerase elongation subunit (family B)